MSNDVSSTEKLTILLVENSRTARFVMSELISKLNFNIHALATGPEAIEYLDQNPVDLIIMDIYMPLQNGYEVAKEIRQSNKDYASTPIIAYTASNNPRDKVQCLNSGIDEVLIKSDDNQELIAWLKNFSSHYSKK